MATTMESDERSRYTDVLDEPVERLLSPIRGYKDKQLLPLAETIRSVSGFFDRIEDYVYVAVHNCQNPADNLTQEESASIHLYTMQFHGGSSLYELLNQSLRAENRDELIPWFAYLKLFLTALYKLRSESGTVWRGVKNVDLRSKYKIGSKIVWWGVSSCTTNIQVLESNKFLGKTGERTIFSIECINGRSIERHSYYKSKEKEIILTPGSYFEVVGQSNPAPELHIIHLKEMTPPIPFLEPPFSKPAKTNASSAVQQSNTHPQAISSTNPKATPNTSIRAASSRHSKATSSSSSSVTSSADFQAISSRQPKATLSKHPSVTSSIDPRATSSRQPKATPSSRSSAISSIDFPAISSQHLEETSSIDSQATSKMGKRNTLSNLGTRLRSIISSMINVSFCSS